MFKLFLVSTLFISSIYAGSINWSKENLDDTIEKLSDKKQKIVMAYFWLEGCNACEYMSDRVFNDDEVSEYINKNFISFKTNKIPMDYPVFAYPTIYFIDEDGNELGDPIMGAKNLDEFMFTIEEIKEKFSN
ncbi:MAG: DUF255 domain-containing protein [Campylobacteraceae bacterium]|jgi:thioredoxin-related protein|nr:DUF255 domain-containing protein [Campylobacteraceae bacterium]MBT3883089.1 DUF255 domain-containing protein [Campylobacteraceae bacterium]MBT4030182.1 DUF255 domain-containing protein [Campylobacteraceae bacterium]MBT4178754.1 DUF255 domain-containing protein [Campylobacteraceae bacterium]MBT4572720.1 DUF255 domain-containing protein [Campylobacteraceae bacterium]